MKACVQTDCKSSVCKYILAEKEVDMAMQSDVAVLLHFRLCVQASIAVVQVGLHCCDV